MLYTIIVYALATSSDALVASHALATFILP